MSIPVGPSHLCNIWTVMRCGTAEKSPQALLITLPPSVQVDRPTNRPPTETKPYLKHHHDGSAEESLREFRFECNKIFLDPCPTNHDKWHFDISRTCALIRCETGLLPPPYSHVNDSCAGSTNRTETVAKEPMSVQCRRSFLRGKVSSFSVVK